MYQQVGTINDLLLSVENKKYILPAIQREFVWKPEQICQLFDSMMQGYPFGTFLFWKVEDNKVNDFKFYQFMQNFDEQNNYLCTVYKDIPQKEHIAVLDGQQRITSLNIALKGSYTLKIGHKVKKMSLYLNLFGDGDPDNNSLYNFKFLTEEEAASRNSNHYWLKVSDFLDGKDKQSSIGRSFSVIGEIASFLALNPQFNKDISGNSMQLHAQKLIGSLVSILNTENLIFAYEEKEQNLDKVLNIFIRMNSGGTPLSYSDLLLSFAVTQWSKLNARDEINDLLQEIEEASEFQFSKDLILRAGLMLSEVNNLSFKLSNFSKDNMVKMENHWEQIKQSFISSCKLLKDFGFDHRTLVYDVAILPIVYFVYRKYCQNLDGKIIKIDKNDAKLIKKWLIETLLKKGIWSSNLESMLIHIRKAIGINPTEFQYERIKEAMQEKDKTLNFTEEDIQNLCQLKYGKDNELKALLLLVFPNSQLVRTHIDHIFPKSIFTLKKMQKLKILNDGSNKLQNLANTIANLQLIPATVNIQKNATQPAEWLDEFYENDLQSKALYLSSQLIEEVPQDLNEFENFHQQRRERIAVKLRKLLDVKSINNSVKNHPDLAALKLCRAPFTEDQNKFLDKMTSWMEVEDQVINYHFIMNDVFNFTFNKKVNSQPADSIKSAIIVKLLELVDGFDKTKDIIGQAYQSGYFMLDTEQSLTSFELDEHLNRDLDSFIAYADSRSVNIIKARCGFDGLQSQTLEEIGQNMQVTRERIRQIERSAFQNFRERLSLTIDTIWENLNQHADHQFLTAYPKTASRFTDPNDFLNFIALLCEFDKNELSYIIYPDINVHAILQDWFLTNKAPMPYSEALYSIVESAGCTEQVARNSLNYAAQNAEICFAGQTIESGIYPKNFNKVYSIIQAALSFPNGANFRELYEQANLEGFSKALFNVDRLDHAINDAVEQDYVFQSDRGGYCHMNYFKINSVEYPAILKEVKKILESKPNSESLHLRMQAYDSSDLLKQYDYFSVRHLVRNLGLDYGIYFTGKSGTDTISLDQEVKPQGQLQIILSWLEQSKRPLTRDEIAKKIRSGSANHASFYLNELMNNGDVVRVSALEYTTPAKAYNGIDIMKLYQDIITYLQSVEKFVDIGIVTEKLNLKYHFNYPKAWYLHLVKTVSKTDCAQYIYSFHNLISLDEAVRNVTIHQIIRDNFQDFTDFGEIYRVVSQQVIAGKTEIYNAVNNVKASLANS